MLVLPKERISIMTDKEIIILCEVLIDILWKYKHEINYEQGVVIQKTLDLLRKKYNH